VAPIYAHSFSPRGRYIVIGGYRGVVWVFDVWTRQRVFEWESENSSESVQEIHWHPTGNLLAVAMYNGNVTVMDMDRFGLGDARE